VRLSKHILYSNTFSDVNNSFELSHVLNVNLVPTQGVEPEPRFGHNCLLLQRPLDKVRRLIFTGGSNGSDLLRNGIELKEVKERCFQYCYHCHYLIQ